jgi:hypothetical protein
MKAAFKLGILYFWLYCKRNGDWITFKITKSYPQIPLSKLTPHVNEITGDNHYGFRPPTQPLVRYCASIRYKRTWGGGVQLKQRSDIRTLTIGMESTDRQLGTLFLNVVSVTDSRHTQYTNTRTWYDNFSRTNCATNTQIHTDLNGTGLSMWTGNLPEKKWVFAFL